MTGPTPAPAAPRSIAPPGTTGEWCGARAAPPDPRPPAPGARRPPVPAPPRPRTAARPRAAAPATSTIRAAPGPPEAPRPAPGARPGTGAEPASCTPLPPTPATARPRSPAPPASPGTPRSGVQRTATPRPRREGATPPARPPPGPCTAGTAAGSPAALPCRSSSPCRDPESSPPPRSPPTRAAAQPGVCRVASQLANGEAAKWPNQPTLLLTRFVDTGRTVLRPPRRRSGGSPTRAGAPPKSWPELVGRPAGPVGVLRRCASKAAVRCPRKRVQTGQVASPETAAWRTLVHPSPGGTRLR